MFSHLPMQLHCFRQNIQEKYIIFTECNSYLLGIDNNTNATFIFQCIVIKKIYYKRKRESDSKKGETKKGKRERKG